MKPVRKTAWQRGTLLWCMTVLVMGLAGCRQEMGEQPNYKTYKPCPMLADDMSAQAPPEGTVAQGSLELDARFYQGMTRPVAADQYMAMIVPAQGTTRVEPTLEQMATLPYVQKIPIEVDASVLERGKVRYEIFCSTCHGLQGDGKGMVVEKGYTEPFSFHTDRLRKAPVGYFFDVITHGVGPMPTYRHQVPTKDRWAIISYIRSLQEGAGQGAQ